MLSKLRDQCQAFFWAFTFLTRLPIPKAVLRNPSPLIASRAVFYFPWVGLLIGALLNVGSAAFGYVFPAGMQAVLCLVLWVYITGALHLDGLADSFDAMAALHKPRVDVLKVLSDPALGVMGGVAMLLLSAVKVVALYYLLAEGELWALILPPMVARLLVPLFMLTTPCAKANGLAVSFSATSNTEGATAHEAGKLDTHNKLQRWAQWVFSSGVMCALSVSIVGVALTGLIGLLATVSLVVWRRVWLRILGGYVGDNLGALIELLEALVLCVLVAVLVGK